MAIPFSRHFLISNRSRETLKEYEELIQKIFPCINPAELRGLSRKELLELVTLDSPVYTSIPESCVTEEKGLVSAQVSAGLNLNRRLKGYMTPLTQNHSRGAEN